MTAGVLIGVDLVDVPRIARAHQELGARFVSAMGQWDPNPAHDSMPHPPVSHRDVAVRFAVLECIVKAIGGRHDGVSLSDLDSDSNCVANELADSIAGEMSIQASFELSGRAHHRLSGATAQCARTLLGDSSGPNRHCSPIVHLRWGERDDLLVAIALISDEGPERKAVRA